MPSKRPSRSPKSPPRRDPRAESTPPTHLQGSKRSPSATVKAPPLGNAGAGPNVAAIEQALAQEKRERAAEAVLMGEMLVRVSDVESELKEAKALGDSLAQRALAAEALAIETKGELEAARKAQASAEASLTDAQRRAKEARAEAEGATKELEGRVTEAEAAASLVADGLAEVERKLEESEAQRRAREQELVETRAELARAKQETAAGRAEVAELRKAQAAMVADLRAVQEAKVTKLRAAHEARVAELGAAHEAAIGELRSALAAEIAGLREAHEVALAEAQSQLAAEHTALATAEARKRCACGHSSRRGRRCDLHRRTTCADDSHEAAGDFEVCLDRHVVARVQRDLDLDAHPVDGARRACKESTASKRRGMRRIASSRRPLMLEARTTWRPTSRPALVCYPRAPHR